MLHENIKRLRFEKAMTQSELAEHLHVVRQTVSKWENGSSVPDALMLQKLAEVLGADVNMLLDLPSSPALLPKKKLSMGWLLFTLFWGLFLIFAPVESDWRNASLSDMPSYTYSAILILEQMRHYIAKPLLSAGAVFTLCSVIRFPFSLPPLLRQGLYITGSILAAVCLIYGIQFTLAIYFGIGSLPIYTWLNFHTWVFSLWMTLAAVLLCLAANDRPIKEKLI